MKFAAYFVSSHDWSDDVERVTVGRKEGGEVNENNGITYRKKKKNERARV